MRDWMCSKRKRIAVDTAATTPTIANTARTIIFVLAIVCAIGAARGGDFDSILRWRNIWPYRGGRTRAICGVPQQPNVFYMAPFNVGLFQSTAYRRTSVPII